LSLATVIFIAWWIILLKNDKLLKLMVPNKNSFSLLFRKMMPHIVFMNDLRSKLEYDKGTK